MDKPTPEQWQTVLDNRGLVWWHLNRCRMSDDEREAAFIDGCIGLLRAAQKYEPDRGYKFSTYALWWIRQAVQRGVAERAGRNAAAAKRGGRDYEAPLTLDGDGEMESVVPDSDPGPEHVAMVTVRLEHVSAVMRAACRDRIDRLICEAMLAGEPNWLTRVSAVTGMSVGGLRRRQTRFMTIAKAADRACP